MSPVILVIDDDPFVAKIVELSLSRSGQFQVERAFDGEQGLHKLGARRPDLILLDYEMPGLDGLETLQQIRSQPEAGTIPVVAISGALQIRPRCAEMISQCDAYIPKPFEYNTLRQTIRGLLDAPGPGI
jgi:CheY-like chemotaxis protein